MQRYNCQPCRRRKSKCDRAQPCMSCVLRATEAYCYTDKEMPASGAAHSARTSISGRADRSSPELHVHSHSSHANGNNHGVGRSPRGIGDESSSSLRPTKYAKHDHASGRTDPRSSTSTSSSSSSSALRVRVSKASALQLALDDMASSLHDVQKLVNESTTQANLWQWDTMVEWGDVEALFPPEEEVREILHCFFNDLNWYQCGVEKNSFQNMWDTSRHQRKPIARHRVALMCTLIAFTLLLAPRSHPASRLREKQTTNPRWQIENARLLIEAFYHTPTHKEEDESSEMSHSTWTEDLLGQLQAETLYCYYCAVAGLNKKGWLSLGKAIRMGKEVDLFDESRWTIFKEAQREERRGIAWDLITMDRWCSMHMGRTGELMGDMNISQPRTAEPTAIGRNYLAQVIKRVFDFIHSSPTMDMARKVTYARDTDAEAVRFYSQLPSELHFERIKDRLSGQDSLVMRYAAPALTFYLSHLFLRCVLARQFLMDPAAPIDLRFASLQHARSTIEAMPFLVTLATSPYVSFPPAWNTQFLFMAAATFASVVLSKDDDRNEPMVKIAGSVDTTPRVVWPDSELDWFASAIFDVVEAFDLVSHGAHNHTARTCKNLLVGLCTSRETLRKRYQERKRERTEEVSGQRGQAHRQPKKRTSLPSVFSPSTYASEGGSGQTRSSGANHSHSRSSTSSGAASDSGRQDGASLSSGDPRTPSSFTPLSAGEVLASMSVVGNMSGGGSGAFANPMVTTPGIFGTDPFGLELPFLDPLEWARLTADLGGGVSS